MKPEIEIMEITPQKARNLLDVAGKNRPLRNSRVDKYAEQMKDGVWQLNGDSIKINHTGQVIDGQHRLWACAQAKKSFMTIVARNIDDSAFVTFDDGGGRTLADALSVMDIKNAGTIAAALVWVRAYDMGGASFDKYPRHIVRGTKKQLIEFYEDGSSEAWQRAARAGDHARGLTKSAGLAAASHYLFQRSSPIRADQFFGELLGEARETHKIIPMLRKRLLKDLYSDRHERLKPGAKFGLILKSWNAWITGEEIGSLRVAASKKEKFPVVVVESEHVRSVAN